MLAERLSLLPKGQAPTEMVKNRKSNPAAKKGGQRAQKQPAPPAISVRRRKPRVQIHGMPGSLAAAARAPFARAAEGARLPDGNPNTTVTFALTRKINLVSNASGDLDVTVLPCLDTAAISTRGTIVDADSLALASVATTANTTHQPVVVTGKTGTGFATTDLATQYTKFRIVAYGARLRLASGVNTTGEFTLAVMPLKGLAPPLNSTKPTYTDFANATSNYGTYLGAGGPRSTLAAYLDSLGLPWSQASGASANEVFIDLSRLPNIPTHATTSASEVSARGMHVRGLPFESAAREYRTMGYKALGLDCQDAVFDVGAAISDRGIQYGTDMSCYRVGGLESLLIGGTGFPNSGAIGSLEIIYHVEAIPNPRYSLLARPTSVVPLVPPSETLDNVLTKLHRLPRISFADVVTTAGDAILGEIEGRVSGAAASGLGSLAGALARLAM